MSEFLFQYEKVNPVSWAYLSSLLLIGLFFKFNRFWSVRNLDLILLILLAPGILLIGSGRREVEESLSKERPLRKMIADAGMGKPPQDADSPEILPTVNAGGDALAGDEAATEAGILTASAGHDVAESPAASPTEQLTQLESFVLRGRRTAFVGFAWLFVVCGLLLVRLLFDPTMVRRPLLEPNLTNGGLLFIGCALFIFLMGNVITSQVTVSGLKGAKGGQAILDRTDHSQSADQVEDYSQFGPGYYALHLLPNIITTPFAKNGHSADPQMADQQVVVAKTMAVLAHLAVLVAMVLIGYIHFENIKMGIGAATVYLMLPYTAQTTGNVDHVLPAALLLWAIVMYRRPAMAGLLIGLAMSVSYYPFFLLPLWLSFYLQRGVMRFLTGLVLAIGIMVVTLIFVSEDLASFNEKIRPMFGFWFPKTSHITGIWGLGWNPVYRITVIAACAVLSLGLFIWPAQKNLGTLLSCTAAIMIAVQFWHAHGDGGGMYMAWFLPLTLLTVFRPNLEDRVAATVLSEDWFTRRRARLAQFQRAA